MNRFLHSFAVVFISLAVTLAPSPLWACACGCGSFDVQTVVMAAPEGAYPMQGGRPASTRPGGLVYLEYDNANQDQNWSGSRSASSDNNSDKLLRTDFITAGVQYMFNARWGMMAEVPVWNRLFKTVDDNGDTVTLHDTALADIRLRGVYTGFSSAMTSGLTFGVKLPTGDFKAAGFDRDSQIGTGGTDLLLGAYHLGTITRDARWTWFSNVLLDQPVLSAGGYRPGAEGDVLIGASFRGWEFAGLRVSPLAQAIGSLRGRDSGTLAHSGDTGYARLLAGPGLHLAAGRLVADAAVNFPVAQDVNGNQLMAAQYWKLSAGWRF